MLYYIILYYIILYYSILYYIILYYIILYYIILYYIILYYYIIQSARGGTAYGYLEDKRPDIHPFFLMPNDCGSLLLVSFAPGAGLSIARIKITAYEFFLASSQAREEGARQSPKE